MHAHTYQNNNKEMLGISNIENIRLLDINKDMQWQWWRRILCSFAADCINERTRQRTNQDEPPSNSQSSPHTYKPPHFDLIVVALILTLLFSCRQDCSFLNFVPQADIIGSVHDEDREID